MPLFDGKYEIISQTPLGGGQTLFDATAPDGERVRIVWYELQPAQEASFERYRRTVKRLKRLERAAVFDVVARPGAHYVAWWPPGDARTAEPDPELAAALRDAGFRPEDADVRRDQRRTRVYGLAFDGTPLPQAEVPTTRQQPDVAPEAGSTRAEPPAWLLTALMTLILVVSAGALLRAGLAARSNDALVIMPQLSGLQVNEAVQRLHGMGLRVETAPLGSDEEAGTVLSVEPGVGSQLRPGRTVRLAYALPPGTVAPAEVPRLVARQYPEDVEAILAEAGLELGSISRIPARQADGLVISQSPGPGTVVGTGAEIDLLVSAGPRDQLTFLPDLVGVPIEEARYLARLAGLPPERIVEDRVPADRSNAGTVVAQSLRPNLPIARDEAVLRLLVATPAGRPRDDARGPSLVGLSLDEARRAAGNVELSVVEVSDRRLPEGVVDQLRDAEDGNSELTLVVNLHPVDIPRPAVRARLREPEPRELAYRWFIEPGIPRQDARVYALTLDGERTLVAREEVRGGDRLEGVWETTEPGPVRFNLTLNGEPYGGDLLVH